MCFFKIFYHISHFPSFLSTTSVKPLSYMPPEGFVTAPRPQDALSEEMVGHFLLHVAFEMITVSFLIYIATT
jgi:hypothetical protein